MATIQSIPTEYAGVRFRSRLEAKWAAFFDGCKWPWTYEPYDYRGWTPDFVIGDRHTAVECKPFLGERDYWHAKQKIVDASYEEPVILLPADPTLLNNPNQGFLQLGWVYVIGSDLRRYTLALHFGWTKANGKLGLCPMLGRHENYVWCVPASKSEVSPISLHEITMPWRLACNATQWKKPHDNKTKRNT